MEASITSKYSGLGYYPWRLGSKMTDSMIDSIIAAIIIVAILKGIDWKFAKTKEIETCSEVRVTN